MSMKRNKELHEAIEAYLTDIGADMISFDLSGTHNAVEFRYRGIFMRQGFTSTPSDHRYVKNTVRDLKRKIRERLDRAPRSP